VEIRETELGRSLIFSLFFYRKRVDDLDGVLRPLSITTEAIVRRSRRWGERCTRKDAPSADTCRMGGFCLVGNSTVEDIMIVPTK